MVGAGVDDSDIVVVEATTAPSLPAAGTAAHLLKQRSTIGRIGEREIIEGGRQ